MGGVFGIELVARNLNADDLERMAQEARDASPAGANGRCYDRVEDFAAVMTRGGLQLPQHMLPVLRVLYQCVKSNEG